MYQRKSFLALWTAAALVVAGGSAFAADPPESSAEVNALTAKAAALYDEGVAAYKKGQWATAQASFLAAWSLKRHWQIAANLADCELQLGKFRDAAEHASFYLRTSPADRHERAQAFLDKASGKIGTLVVSVDQVGVEIVVDGQMVGKSPLPDPVFVEPGHHALEAHSGAKFGTATADVDAGARRSVALVITDPVGGKPERRSLVPGVVLGGVAGAALVSGIVLTALSKSRYADAKLVSDAIAKAGKSCVMGDSHYDARCVDLHSTASTSDAFHNAGIGLFIGAGATAVGALTYLLWPAQSKRDGSAVVRVTPTASTADVGVIVSGAF